MASYIVAASLFILGSSYLMHFVIEPPGGSTTTLEHQALRSNALNALDVLLGSPGYPAVWEADAPGIDRLGLIERGTSIRIDPNKFDALARGKYASSTADEYIDYAEAKEALGIEGYEFHLRAYPVTEVTGEGEFGLQDMGTFRVGYVGSWASGSQSNAALQERYALDRLALSFSNATRTGSALTGDVFKDDSTELRTHLLPVIGPTIQETVLSNGAGIAFDFYRVNESTYDPLADPVALSSDTLSSAMALSSDGATLGYTKNRELRAIIGEFNLTGDAATIAWKEWVDTDRGNGTYDCGDYGFVEVSFNNGSSWSRLTDSAATRSQDCNSALAYIHGSNLKARTAEVSCNCTSALLAFHWIGDNDNNAGYGWVVDDVTVTTGTTTVLRETFNAPEYDMLVIGSDVDHMAFTPNDIKNAIRDYVDLYGGRLLVLGGQNNVQWLDRLFDAGSAGASAGVASPDTTHPLLTLPNQLSYAGYTPTGSWEFTTEESTLFSMVMGTTASSQTLTVSRTGAWSSGDSVDGAVILTSYQPYQWDYNETARFFANAAIYGKYHYLFLDVGPEVPSGEMVASASRTATMNKYRTGDANYTEMAFILYLWPGDSIDGTYEDTAITPTRPRSLTANSTSGNVWVNWTTPASPGSHSITEYEVFRGNAPENVTTSVKIVNISATPNATSFSFHDSNVTNGATYYYNVTARSPAGRGTPSDEASTTPVALAGAPGSVTATPSAGLVTISWSNPGTSATGTILGYRVSASTSSSGPFDSIAEVGNVTSYAWAPGDTAERYFKVDALNARGYGTLSSAVGPAAAFSPTPIDGPTLVVTALSANRADLTWVEPDLLGQTLESWLVWRNGGSGYELVANLSPASRSYADTPLTGATNYTYKVQGFTNVGMGTNSTEQTALVPGLAGAPSTFTATSSALVGGTILLAWTPPTDLAEGTLEGYRLWRSNDSSTWSALLTFNASDVGFTDQGLGPSALRYYKLQAITSAGNGTNSSVKSATTMPPAAAPGAFAAANNTAAGSIALSWTAPASLNGGVITGYKLWRSTDSTSWTLLASPGALNVSFTDAGLGNNATRYYKLQAVTDVGDGTNTSIVSNRTASVPYPPTGVNAATVVTTTVSWTDATTGGLPITSYEVCRANSQNGVYGDCATALVSPYATLGSYGGKWFKVRAYNAAGWSDYSAPDQA